MDLTLQTHTVSTDFKFDSNNDQTLHVGLLGRYQDNFANPETGIRRLIPDYEKIDLGLFATYSRDLNTKTTLEAGLRYDFNRIDAKKF